LYLDQNLYNKVELKATEREMSLSAFVRGVLKEHLGESWPEGYFEKYVGSIKDDSFEAPEDLLQP
jgi:hypothetical protein